jgi:hypothetical protein
MAHGKVSPIVATCAALAEVTGQPHLLPPIEESLKHIAVASQLIDDIGDWRHDVEVGHHTYFQSLVLPPAQWGDSGPDPDQLQAEIDRNWHDVAQMACVIEWLDRSSAAVAGLECPGWLEYVDGYRILADKHRTRFVARHLVRVLRPLVESQ